MSDHATIYLKNNTSSRVLAQLYHKNSTNGAQSIGWIIEANSTSSTGLNVSFKTGPFNSAVQDYWFLVLHVVSGSSAGTYVSGDSSSSSIASPSWKENQLRSSDSGTKRTFTVDTSSFRIDLASGAKTTNMRRLRDFQPIQNVFVLMLENHSYDNILANCGIPGTTHATTSNYNMVAGVKYSVHKPAPASMSRDPGHEFNDVLAQLCGPSARYTSGQSYPKILGPNDTGFASSYASLNPGAGTNLNYQMEAASSPSITAMPDGSFRTAFLRNESGENRWLTVVGPNYTFMPQWGNSPGSSPSIAACAPMRDGWVGAFCAAGTNHLWVVQQSNADTGCAMNPGTTPSITTLADGKSWEVAFQGPDSNLWVYSSTTLTGQKKNLGMKTGSSPSIAKQPTSGVWVAFQANTGKLWVTNFASSQHWDTASMLGTTSPSIASTSDGKWFAAYQSDKGTLGVVSSKSDPIDLRVEMAAGTNPSIAVDSKGVAYIAVQTASGNLAVVSYNGTLLTTGPKLKPGTSPSIAVMTKGGWQVAFQDTTGAPRVLDNKGNSPQPSAVGDIMACFDTPTQLPIINQLAHKFTVCDHWYSSLPGPTWPNRFFAHCASSGGMDDSPGTFDVGTSIGGASYAMPNGSIYDRIKHANWPSTTSRLSYRFYQDAHWTVDDVQTAVEIGAVTGGVAGATAALALADTDSLYSAHTGASGGTAGLGWVPQVLALSGISTGDFESMTSYVNDLTLPYDRAYTFVEPHYGDITGNSYKGGSSQHPRDDTYGGEALLKAVYEGLRNSPLWYTSVLIVTYDEHGGFYDGVTPPAATAPGDKGTYGPNHGFTFTQYGVRVPALVISPMVAAGVNSSTYDHSSIPKTLENVFKLSALTNRDKAATGVDGLCKLSIAAKTIRTDCPTSLGAPIKTVASVELPTDAERQAQLDEPLPEHDNLHGVLRILLKTGLELGDDTDAYREELLREFQAIQTRRDAGRFGERIWQLIAADRAAKASAVAAVGPDPTP